MDFDLNTDFAHVEITVVDEYRLTLSAVLSPWTSPSGCIVLREPYVKAREEALVRQGGSPTDPGAVLVDCWLLDDPTTAKTFMGSLVVARSVSLGDAVVVMPRTTRLTARDYYSIGGAIEQAAKTLGSSRGVCSVLDETRELYKRDHEIFRRWMAALAIQRPPVLMRGALWVDQTRIVEAHTVTATGIELVPWGPELLEAIEGEDGKIARIVQRAKRWKPRTLHFAEPVNPDQEASA